MFPSVQAVESSGPRGSGFYGLGDVGFLGWVHGLLRVDRKNVGNIAGLPPHITMTTSPMSVRCLHEV